MIPHAHKVIDRERHVHRGASHRLPAEPQDRLTVPHAAVRTPTDSENPVHWDTKTVSLQAYRAVQDSRHPPSATKQTP